LTHMPFQICTRLEARRLSAGARNPNRRCRCASQSFTEIKAEFVERAHRMVWCDMATVGLDGRPRIRIVHPVWQGDTAWMTSMRLGSKADDIDRNQSCWQKRS